MSISKLTSKSGNNQKDRARTKNTTIEIMTKRHSKTLVTHISTLSFFSTVLLGLITITFLSGRLFFFFLWALFVRYKKDTIYYEVVHISFSSSAFPTRLERRGTRNWISSLWLLYYLPLLVHIHRRVGPGPYILFFLRLSSRIRPVHGGGSFRVKDMKPSESRH